MDAPDLDPALHEAALRGLARLNRFSGISRLMYRRLRNLARRLPRPLRVLDMATGSGDLPIDWLQRARRERIALQVTGVDVSPQAILSAAAGAAAAGVDADWLVANALEDPLPGEFDVVTCSLFMHHLQNEDVVRLLRVMQSATGEGGPAAGSSTSDVSCIKKLLVCDLARSRMNLIQVSLAARLLSRSPVVHGDAALSVRAAMTRREFARLAETALGQPVAVDTVFPCRFIAEIPLR